MTGNESKPAIPEYTSIGRKWHIATIHFINTVSISLNLISFMSDQIQIFTH